jgi:hypothetical protein
LVIRVSLVLLSLCAAAVVCRADAPARLLARVRIVFRTDSSSGMIESIRADAIAEAAHVWEPYGIAISDDTFDDSDTDRGKPSRIVVVMDGARVQSAQSGALGSIRFTADGVPDSIIALDYAAVVRLATGARTMGVEAQLWPTKLRDQVIARALGRALAHELGHYVLRSPHHTATGLMRATYHASMLAAPERQDFTLTAPDEQRLHIVLAAGLLELPATASLK